MSHVRVLRVEHHPEYMGTLKYLLETAGYEVMVATNGDQALRLLTTLDVDGVLLKYDLPDATGSAVRAEMVRAQCISITVLQPSGREEPYKWKLLLRPIGFPRRLWCIPRSRSSGLAARPFLPL